MTGFAVKNDHSGWRAIDDVSDINHDEYFSVNPVAPVEPKKSRDEIELMRLTAYADPVTGSDRYFSEASRLTAMGGSSADISAAMALGVSRAAEIAAMYPWPTPAK